MGNASHLGNIGCTPTLAAPGCTPSLALPPAPGCTPPRGSAKHLEECFDPCTPALAGRTLDPLTDQECADIALVQATVRGESSDVIRALAMGASPNTIAELTLRMGEPSKKKRGGRAAHMTPLMRACELGHEDIVLQLLKARASPLQCDSHGWTPLCHALGAGEVAIARLIAQQPGFKLERQREICRKLEGEILMKCRNEASEEALSAVEMELGPGGLLDPGEGGEERSDSITGGRVGAEPGKVHPLVYNEGQDLLTDLYGYPYADPM